MQDKIQEIMGLVTQHAYIYYSAAIGGCRDADDVKESECAIESKLRDLVREPLSEESKKLLVKEWSLSSESFGSDFLDGISYAERAHVITNASGVE